VWEEVDEMRTVGNRERGHYYFEDGKFVFFVGKNSWHGRENGAEQVEVPVGTKLTLWGYEDPYEAIYQGDGEIKLGNISLELNKRGDAFIAEKVPEGAE